MPKKALEIVLSKMQEDLFRNYEPGSRYKTHRQLSEELDVSIQTISKAVSAFVAAGYLASREKSGVVVIRKPLRMRSLGKKILVLCKVADHHFYDSFLQGIETVCQRTGAIVEFQVDTELMEDTIAFGDHLTELYRRSGAEGLVLLAYHDIDLAIYHAMTQGVVVLTDIASSRLDFLPSVQTDEVHHCEYAAERLFHAGKSRILMADFMVPGNPRHAAFLAKMKSLNPLAKVKYCSLRQPGSQFELLSIFRDFDESTGVFSGDAFSNATLAGQFVQHQVSTTNSFIVYDCEDIEFRFPGLPPVPTCAPSFRALGERLAEKLIDRIEQGFWQEPLRELM